MLSNIYLEYLNNYEHVQWISFLLSHPTIIGVSKGNILLTYGESGLPMFIPTLCEYPQTITLVTKLEDL